MASHSPPDIPTQVAVFLHAFGVPPAADYEAVPVHDPPQSAPRDLTNPSFTTETMLGMGLKDRSSTVGDPYTSFGLGFEALRKLQEDAFWQQQYAPPLYAPGTVHCSHHCIYRLHQASSLLRAGEAASSLEAVEAIVSKQGRTADALVVRGACHAKLGNTIQARADFVCALELDKSHADAALYLSKVSGAGAAEAEWSERQ